MSNNGNTKESKNPAVLLHKLACNITGLNGDAVAPFYQFAIDVAGSDLTSLSEQDEFCIAETIKKTLVQERREHDAVVFTELHRRLLTSPILKNRWSILCLLAKLKDGQDSYVNKTKVFTKGLASHYEMLSSKTPMGEGSNEERIQGVDAISLPSTRISSSVTTAGRGLKQSASSESAVSVASSCRTVGSRVSALLSYWQTSPTNPNLKLQLKRNAEVNGNRNGDYQNFSSEISESVLLREVVYTIQGIEGKVIRFGSGKDGIWIDPKMGIPKPTRKILLQLSELGWLYNKVCKYCDSRVNDKSLGLVGKSFIAALQQELMEYYRLLAVLESQLQQEDEQGIGSGYGGLTLRRLVVWTVEPFTRLKVLASLVDICKGLKGGALASAIHSYLQHGDPYIRSLVKNILASVSVPIYSLLHQWIIDGELDDIYQEFFVAANQDVRGDDKLWHEKYTIRNSMVPTFLSLSQAKKILSTGKSINFLRQVCLDRTSLQWREAIQSTLEKTNVECLFNEDHDGELQTMIDVAYQETSSHVLNVMNSTYKFMDHLKAVRRYLLLGQGDFIRHLMDLLESDLSKPAGTLYLHSLSGILETAIRSTNAQFDDPDILKRLDVRLMDVSLNECGWDVFSLDYHMDGPIGTVFTPQVILTYFRLFNSLWRAKRMEYVLSSLWKTQMTNSRLLKRIPEVGPIMHQCHMLTSEMVHFVQQMQYYITFEVMECSWDILEKKVKSAKDLDQVIAAHEEFLETIMTRALLDFGSEDLLNQMRATYDLIIQFQNVQDTFFRNAVRELDLRHGRKEGKREKGSEAVDSTNEETERKRQQEFVKTVVNPTKSHLRVLTSSYQDMVQRFLLMLTSHTDVSLQFLSFRLDFNEHYKNRDSRLHRPLTYQHRRLSAMSLSTSVEKTSFTSFH